MHARVQLSALRRFYRGKRVLVTGHTGFKGSWLALWLSRMGADTHGLALPPDQGPDNLFERAGVASAVRSAEIDVRDAAAVLDYFAAVRPQIVFHLAARAWVQQGFEDPLATFATNTLGTAHLLEAARQTPAVEAVVCVTTDKVYRNREWEQPYRETDELGGLDPYSASKAAAELIARCYAHALRPVGRRFALATARGGNVLGGGDWAPHRIVPDIVRALRTQTPLRLRRPTAIRPWQHVLDLCHGYLLLAHRLLDGAIEGESQLAWNFGPGPSGEMTVAALTAAFLEKWGGPGVPIESIPAPHHESGTLRLDASRANERLGWRPALGGAETVEWTAEWYRGYLGGPAEAPRLLKEQIDRFEAMLAGAGELPPSVASAVDQRT